MARSSHHFCFLVKDVAASALKVSCESLNVSRHTKAGRMNDGTRERGEGGVDYLVSDFGVLSTMLSKRVI